MSAQFKIYKDQDYQITLDTLMDLSAVTDKKIFYKKPDKTKSSWVPEVVGTALQFNVTGAVNDQSGVWDFQSYVEVGSKKFFGEIVSITILNNIKQ